VPAQQPSGEIVRKGNKMNNLPVQEEAGLLYRTFQRKTTMKVIMKHRRTGEYIERKRSTESPELDIKHEGLVIVSFADSIGEMVKIIFEDSETDLTRKRSIEIISRSHEVRTSRENIWEILFFLTNRPIWGHAGYLFSPPVPIKNNT
jgi:hypothetical protein